MKGEFGILVACAILVHIALVQVLPTAAGIQKEDIDDIALMGIYEEATILQLKKAVETIFPRNLEGYLTKLGLKDGDSNEKKVNGTEICTNLILARGIAALDTTFATALIVNPDITSAAMSAYPSLSSGLGDLARGVCIALKLAVGTKSNTTAAEIQAIANKVVSATADWNQHFFNAARTGRELEPEINLASKQAENRSTVSLMTAFNDTLFGIQNLAFLDLEAESEAILSVMEIFRIRVLNSFVSSIRDKFDIAETLFLTPPIIPSATKKTFECKSENPMETSKLQAQNGLATMFNTILRLLAKTPVNNPDGYQNDSPNTVSAKEKTSAAFNNAIDATMEGVLKINSQCLSIFNAKRDPVRNKVNKIVDIIYIGINSITSTDPGMILGEIEAMENETIDEGSDIIVDLIDGILSCVKRSDSQISLPRRSIFGVGLPGFQHGSNFFPSGSLLQQRPYISQPNCMCMLPVTALTSPYCANLCANGRKSPAGQTSTSEIDAEFQNFVQPDQEKLITGMKNFFQLIFGAIKVRIVESSSGIRTKGAIDSPMRAAQAEALATGETAVGIIVDVIINFLKASTNNELDKSACLSAIGVIREKTVFEIEKGIDIIFSNIIADNENVPEDIASDIIEAGRVAASEPTLAAVGNIFCAFIPTDPETILAVQEEAMSKMQIAVDSVYSAIQETQASNSCELLPKLDAMTATVAGNFDKMTNEVFDGIRSSPNYDVKMEPSLARTQNLSILHSHRACVALFNGLRTFVIRNCPGSEISTVDDMSLVTSEYNIAASEVINWSEAVSVGVTSVTTPKKDDIPAPTQTTATHWYGTSPSLNLPLLAPLQIKIGK